MVNIDIEAGIPSCRSPRSADDVDDLESIGRSEPDRYFRKLLETTLKDGQRKLSYGFLSFDVLHRLILLNHQKRLAEHVETILRNKTTSDQELQKIDHNLHAYCKQLCSM